MNEKSKIFKTADNSELNVLVDVIISKAENKDGDKMFDIGHKPKFKIKADTDVISRVASSIMSQDNLTDIKKN